MEATMTRVLITGGAGFIGSNFVHHALAHHPEWQLVVLDKLTYAGNLENLKDVLPRIALVQGDIADPDAVRRAMEGADIALNFAAESHVDRSILDAAPFIETNVKGTQVLLDAARAIGLKRFVHISTDEVYGSIEKGEFTEKSPLSPNSPYAASKAAADLLCRSYFKTYALPVIITRSSNNYGPYQFPEKLIPLMIYNALEGKPLPVYGRGQNTRDWLYVEDNCRAIAGVVEKGQLGEIYNIGGSAEMQNIDLIRRLVKVMADRLGKSVAELEKLITYVKDRPGHDWRYALDASKISHELGWKPAVALDEGLRRTVDWYLGNRDWLAHVISGEYQKYVARVYEHGWR
jgi:dTDP-glucose 4,6-dehydratase